jgi:uncharacterized membrane-anchored protein
MKFKLLVLVAALQTVWLLGTSITHERALATGTLISLETAPVDPRDMLRGDYVVLNYKISNVPRALFSPSLPNEMPPGKKVYVLLAKRGDFYELAKASEKPLSAASGKVMLQGKTEYSWNTNTVSVAYGLERYYVREGTGDLRGKITVNAVVPHSGHAQVKQILADGKPWEPNASP